MVRTEAEINSRLNSLTEIMKNGASTVSVMDTFLILGYMAGLNWTISKEADQFGTVLENLLRSKNDGKEVK